MTYTYKTIDNGGDPAFNQLLAINDSGVIAGYFGDGTMLPNKGYVLSPPYGAGSFTNENFPDSVQTQVTGINNAGVTTGFWVDASGNSLGFVDDHGKFLTERDPLAPTIKGIVNEQFLGINDEGDVAGFYANDATGDTSGFIYSIKNNNFGAVNINGATSVTATDINDRGQVSGFFTKGGNTDGFIDLQGKLTVLSGPAGASDVQALGLNNAGMVVGSYVDSHGNTDGFVYNTSTGVYTTVIDPNAKPVTAGGPTETVVNGINDQGQLVGFYMDAKGNIDGMLVNPGQQSVVLQFTRIDDAADPAFNQLLAINDVGTIVGYDGDGTALPNKGYEIVAGKYINENFPTSAQTQVTGINNAGTTSGFWVDGNGDSLGFVESNGNYTTAVDPLAPTIKGVVSEQFLGVNDLGQVAGFYTNDAAGDASGFVFDSTKGTFTAVHIAGATSITATDVNDSGMISGFYTKGTTTAGFLDANGKITTLTGPAGASDVQALGLNNAGSVVGSFMDAQGNTHGFLYSAGTYTTIDDPSAHGMTVINGINDLGQMVGFYQDSTAAHAVHGMEITLQALGGSANALQTPDSQSVWGSLHAGHAG